MKTSRQPSQSFLENRLAEQDDAHLRKRVKRRKAAEELYTTTSEANLQRLVQMVCSKSNLKRKFGHLSDSLGVTGAT